MNDAPGRPAREPLGDLGALAGTAWAPWPVPLHVETTPSTMVEVEELAAAGAVEGTVVVAEEQTAGRGRRGREWLSAPRAGLWWSLLLRPQVPADRLGWLPLVVGLGVVRALRAEGGIDALLKWPNDVVVDPRSPVKLAGILAERLADGSVVVGVGINVDQDRTEIPEGAGSLRTLGRPVDRTALLVAVLASVAQAYRDWAAGQDISGEYAALSATLDSVVEADVGGRAIRGRAVGLGPAGELVVETEEGRRETVSAGDVTLVRPAL